MYKEYYMNIISGSKNYTEVYNAIKEATEDNQISDDEWSELYALARPILCELREVET